MSYQGISVREAIDKLNAPNEGWYLPEVQRQYVWGERHESEEYICLLLDSLLRRYPIGGIVLWRTRVPVPFRYFLDDYFPGKFARLVDKGRWGEPKALVYDGQQRLQTLRSVLRYRFNGRVLHYDALFNSKDFEADQTGFLFRDTEDIEAAQYVRMTELVTTQCDLREKIILEERMLRAAGDDQQKQYIVKENVQRLWDTFVDTNVKSIAYFEVRAESSGEVNEVFRRLNTGGVSLTQLELVLGKIKAVYPDYEEKLWVLSERIKTASGGIEFSSTAILQFFHLLVKGTIRIDGDRMEACDIDSFQQVLETDVDPLVETFEGYLSGQFNINNYALVPRWSAVLPIAAYLCSRHRSKCEWRIRALPHQEMAQINQYFLHSQLCDWNTQTMVNKFAAEARKAGGAKDIFPLKEIRDIAIEKNRTGKIHEYQLLAEPLFSTKVMTPHRTYIFREKKPQVDHIFPKELADADDRYREIVDILWNLQPLPAEVNNYKRARNPKEFFNAQDGKKYLKDYDFVPEADSPLWENPETFVAYRKGKMLEQLKGIYSIVPASIDTAD